MSVSLQLDFLNPCPDRRVRYPLHQFIKTITGNPSSSPQSWDGDGDFEKIVSCGVGKANAEDVTCIEDLLTRDPFYELSEQEKAVLWRARELCRQTYPAALPWLVQAVDWLQHEAVAEFYRLLAHWPRPLSVDVALALLGVAGLSCLSKWQSDSATSVSVEPGAGMGAANTGVADPLLRDIAVQGLQAGLANADLADYLLQLVQVRVT